MKVVVNRCYGGFGLSYEAVMEYAKRKGFQLYAFADAITKDGHIYFEHYIPYEIPKKEMTINHLKNKKTEGPLIIHYSKTPLNTEGKIDRDTYFSDGAIERNDPILVEIVEALGEMANGGYAELEVVEIPDDVEWEISDYDGVETVEEKHRSW